MIRTVPTRYSRFVRLAAALIGLVFIAGCQSTRQNKQTSLLPGPPYPTNLLNSNPATPSLSPTLFPPVPAHLPKPLVLGPAYSAVVPVSRHMAQPWIRVEITPESHTRPWINPALYRGRIEIIHLPDGNFIALNVLPIESYLAGVLSRELYGSWLQAAYNAQAIAARTYALYQMQTFGKTHPWDVTGTQNSQVYGGRNAETPRAWKAIHTTWGQVMFASDDGATGIFCAYYSACNGGATQSATDAWGDHPLPELGARVTGNLDDGCSLFSWPTMRLSKVLVRQAVNLWGQRNNLPYLAQLGPLSEVEITRRNTITNRPTVITLTDVFGHIGQMRAEEFRLALVMDPNRKVKAPPSSFFDIHDAGSSILLMNGHGYGHGIGLSQWGAQALAQRGYSGDYIVSFFYPGEWLSKLW